METDPTNDKSESSEAANDDEPVSTEGPGSVTVDEPTESALSGTSEDDFKGTDSTDSTESDEQDGS